MHIDSLTITALIIFIIMLGVFVRFCMVKVCTVAAMQWHGRSDAQDTIKAQGGSGTGAES